MKVCVWVFSGLIFRYLLPWLFSDYYASASALLFLRHRSTDCHFLKLLETLIGQLYPPEDDETEPTFKSGVLPEDIFELIIGLSHFLPTVLKVSEDNVKGWKKHNKQKKQNNLHLFITFSKCIGGDLSLLSMLQL